MWLHAIRPHTLGASLLPVLVGASFAARAGALDGSVLAACVSAALALQITTNLANDAFDYLHAIDLERVGPLRVTQAGWLRPAQVLGGAALAIGVALACGVYLVGVGGVPILAIGLISIAAALGYSSGPFPLASHGLGEVAAFVFFGVVAVTGSAYLHLAALDPGAVALSLPVGCLVAAIMVVNNLRDLATDARSGKRTLAVRLGERRTRQLYAGLVASAWIACAPLALLLSAPALLLPWIATPLAVAAVREIGRAREGAAFGAALAHTARLHAVHGGLLCLALIV